MEEINRYKVNEHMTIVRQLEFYVSDDLNMFDYSYFPQLTLVLALINKLITCHVPNGADLFIVSVSVCFVERIKQINKVVKCICENNVRNFLDSTSRQNKYNLSFRLLHPKFGPVLSKIMRLWCST